MNFDKDLNSSPVQSQWIFSLAVSIVCCAVLFVIMALFITDQRSGNSATSLRLDVMQNRQEMLMRDIDALRQNMIALQTSMSVATPSPTQASGVVVDKAPEPPVDEKATKN